MKPNLTMRPFKVTMLGAGSFFTYNLVRDTLLIPGADSGEIALVDIDSRRLGITARLIKKLISELGKPGWKLSSSTRRGEVLKGTDYIVNCIEVSGTACVRFDNDIPAKYGVDQCIGDTIGPGGLFKALRTIPVFLEVLKDAERLCPRALVLNYTNPMNMMCLAAGRQSSMQVVGLCHSVQGTSHLLAKRAGIPYEEMEWECAGINHFAWFTRLRDSRGRDLYPALMARARRDLAGRPADKDDAGDLVRKDMMLHYGAFITESSGHLSEYLPYYRTRKEIMRRYCRSGMDGASRHYADHWPANRKKVDREREALALGEKPLDLKRSWEYASHIIEASETDKPYRIYGNVMNQKDGAGPLIANLPTEGCVEVACMVDHSGVHPTRYGSLPAHMAGLCSSNMRMFDLGAEAAIHKSKELAFYALSLDPLTSAKCAPSEIKSMAAELFKAEKDHLPGFH